MTPKEKALELVGKYLIYFPEILNEKEFDYVKDKAKQCALVAVDEMLDFRNGLYMNEGSIVYQYLMDVKQEIEQL